MFFVNKEQYSGWAYPNDKSAIHSVSELSFIMIHLIRPAIYQRVLKQQETALSSLFHSA
jgi:hypothetical protein